MAMVLLWISYPLLVHAATVIGHADLQAVAVGWLVVLMALPGLRRGSRPALLLALGGVVLALGARQLNIAAYFLYLPPILINLMMLGLFAQSLRPGQTPIATATARQIRGTLTPGLVAYTRKITIVWCGLFAAMAGLSAAFALFAPAVVWSTFTNFISYLIIGAAFLVEYLLRPWLIPDEEHVSLRRFLQGLIRNPPRA